MTRSSREYLPLLAVAGFNLIPVLGLLHGDFGFAEAFFWLAWETVTIWVWTIAQLRRARQSSVFWTVHYGLFFALPSLALGVFAMSRWGSSDWWWVALLALGSLLTYGWSVRQQIRTRRPVTGSEQVLAYLRLALVFGASFVVLTVPGGASDDPRPLDTAALDSRAVWVLVLKALLEVQLAWWTIAAAQRRAADKQQRGNQRRAARRQREERSSDGARRVPGADAS